MKPNKQKPSQTAQSASNGSSFDLSEFTFLGDQVLVRAIREETVNGLIKPEQYDDTPEFGEVVKVGPGKMLDNGQLVPSGLEVGDKIFFGKYSSVKTRSAGKDWFIIRSEDVMAIAPRK